MHVYPSQEPMLTFVTLSLKLLEIFPIDQINKLILSWLVRYIRCEENERKMNIGGLSNHTIHNFCNFAFTNNNNNVSKEANLALKIFLKNVIQVG